MIEVQKIEDNVSKLAFLFLAYSVVTGGYITKILSCQLQHALVYNQYLKHVVGFLLIFVFIMLEGGWDFDEQENLKAPVNWSNGNSFHSLIYSVGLYLLFVLSSKMQLIPNIMFLSTLLILYIIHTQRKYWSNRQRIEKSLEETIQIIEKTLIGGSGILFLYGIYDYIRYQRKQYGSAFRWSLFFLGKPNCRTST
jgi:hypothetical protein